MLQEITRINIKPGRYGYTRIIQVFAESGIYVNYGEQENGDIVIDSMDLGDPEDPDFHPAWLLSAAQETADALREEMTVNQVQSLEDALHRKERS